MSDNKFHLLIYEHPNISRDEVLKLGAQLSTPVVLTYSPRECRFARRTGQHWAAWSDDKKTEVTYDFRGVYELRLFSVEGEFRWLNNPATKNEHGSASFVTDKQSAPSVALVEDADWKCAVDEAGTERIDNQYLLWGEGFDDGLPAEAHWSCLAEGRVGKLYVPVSGVDVPRDVETPQQPPSSRVILKSYEYIGLESGMAGDHGSMAGKHGNCAIIAERLSHLESSNGVVTADTHLLLTGQE